MFKRNKDGVVLWRGALTSATKKYFEQSKRRRLMSRRSRKINRKI